MSKIRLYGETSGYVELQAPDVAFDGTIVLPNDPSAIATEAYADAAVAGLATEAYADAAGVAGSGLVAVKSAIFTGTQTASLASGSNTDVNNLEISHALNDENNTLIFFLTIQGSTSSNNRPYNFRVLANGTPIMVGDDLGGGRQRSMAGLAQINVDVMMTASGVGMYSAGTTDSVTYKVNAQNQTNETRAFFVNRTFNNDPSPYGVSGLSSLVMLEVKV